MYSLTHSIILRIYYYFCYCIYIFIFGDKSLVSQSVLSSPGIEDNLDLLIHCLQLLNAGITREHYCACFCSFED